MISRAILALNLIIGFAHCAFAEEALAGPSNIERQGQGSGEIQVALEMHGLTIPEEVHVALELHCLTLPLAIYDLTIPEETLVYFQKCKMALPSLQSNTIFDKEQSHILLEAVKNDPLGYVCRTPAPNLPHGEEGPASADAAAVNTDSVDTFYATCIETFQATVSEERQTVELRLTFRKDKDGKEWHPPMNATIPLGSSLLIHPACAGQSKAFGSGSGDWADNLLAYRATVGKDSGLYLLVTPQITHPKQESSDEK